MTIPIYQVDAFSDRVFRGNPAAICLLDQWPDDAVLQDIALENNLSETAYLIHRQGFWDIRWFTPSHEMDLAGHPTLAAAWLIAHRLEPGVESILFKTQKAGDLTVRVQGDDLVMDFPARPGRRQDKDPSILRAAGLNPTELLKARDWVFVLENEDQVRSYEPDYRALGRFSREPEGVILTAPGADCDFVSRFFVPGTNGFEDPVTGSAHCTLTPYWSRRLKKSSLVARQISPRGGTLQVEDLDDRVIIIGQAVLYLEGEIHV